jgi:hypothetical protein
MRDIGNAFSLPPYCQGEGGAFERRKAEIKKKKALASSTGIEPVSHA